MGLRGCSGVWVNKFGSSDRGPLSSEVLEVLGVLEVLEVLRNYGCN